jgi:predicted enzyme related to lactoylglutathione lyase
MSSLHGHFVWYELLTTDPKAAEAFYRGVLGWRARDSGLPDRSYTLLSVGESDMGGLMMLPPDACAAGAKPSWSGYVAVDDADAYAARIKKAGGAIHHGPEDIPGVGRFAVTTDLHGAKFNIIRGFSDAPPQPPAPGTPGHVGWRELHAGNLDSAFAFYAGLFGWTKAEAMDMGPMGIYQLFAIDGVPSGGMMTRTKDMPVPAWLYYFNVDHIDAGAKRVTDGGGRILHGPHEVPGGSWIVQCRDPQDAMFALVGPRR